jgi:hypothetical protein
LKHPEEPADNSDIRSDSSDLTFNYFLPDRHLGRRIVEVGHRGLAATALLVSLDPGKQLPDLSQKPNVLALNLKNHWKQNFSLKSFIYMLVKPNVLALNL